MPTTQIAISEVMADGAPRKPSEIAELLDLTRGAASAAMGRMVRAGVLQKLGAGQYRRESVEALRSDSALTLSDHGQAQKQEPPVPATVPPALDRLPQSEASTTTRQNGSLGEGSLRDEVARGAFAAKLWLKDVTRFRFGDYHWEKRRRRMHDRDRKTGRATAR